MSYPSAPRRRRGRRFLLLAAFSGLALPVIGATPATAGAPCFTNPSEDDICVRDEVTTASSIPGLTEYPMYVYGRSDARELVEVPTTPPTTPPTTLTTIRQVPFVGKTVTVSNGFYKKTYDYTKGLPFAMYRSPGRTPTANAPVMIVLHGGGGTPFGSGQKAVAKWWARRGYQAIVPVYYDLYAKSPGLNVGAPAQLAAFDGCVANPTGPSSGWTGVVGATKAPTAGSDQARAWCAQHVMNTVRDPEGATGMDATLREAQRNLQTLVRMLKVNRSFFGIDPSRISVYGESFGGITAIRAATRPDDPGNVVAREATSGPNGTLLRSQGVDSRIHRALAVAASDCPGTAPTTVVREGVPWNWGTCTPKGGPGDAPYLVFHGSEDAQLPRSEAEAVCNSQKQLTAAGGYPVCVKVQPYNDSPAGAATCLRPAVDGQRPQNRITLKAYAESPGRDHYIGECPWRSGVTASGDLATAATGTAGAHTIGCWSSWWLGQPTPSAAPATCPTVPFG